MSASGSYKDLGANILEEQRAKEDAARRNEEARRQARADSGKRALQWWQAQMVPEINQAKEELSVIGVSIDFETEERQISLGIMKGAMTLTKYSNKYYPYIFVIEEDEIKVYRDYSIATRANAVSLAPKEIDELCGSTTDPAYPSRVVHAIVETTLKG